MLAVDVERDRLDSAVEHAQAMLDRRQQPLVPQVRAPVEQAVRSADREAFLEALGLASRHGYT